MAAIGKASRARTRAPWVDAGLRLAVVAAVALLSAGCGEFGPVRELAEATMAGTEHDRRVEAAADAIERRLQAAASSGLAQARARGDAPRVEIPATLRAADGRFDPVVSRFALNAEGQLHGAGTSLWVLTDELDLMKARRRAEVDRRTTMVWGGVISAVTSLVLLVFGFRAAVHASRRRRRRLGLSASATPVPTTRAGAVVQSIRRAALRYVPGLDM